jgi:hypothetical protein
MGTESLDILVRAWNSARETETGLRKQVRDAIVFACDSGLSEVKAAHLAGVDRQTIRAWRGKTAKE